MSSDAKSEKSEYENVYLMDNPMYQVFSVLLTDDDGNNICHHVGRLVNAIETNNKLMAEVIKTSRARSVERERKEEKRDEKADIERKKKRRVRISPRADGADA